MRLGRLIPYQVASGNQQMALDDWLLKVYCPQSQCPVLRFYGWWPAAISLGYLQRHYPSHWHNLSWQGRPLEIVRRPSGGRAVLHQGTLTYSLVLPWGGGDRRQLYNQICQFLVVGWRQLGITLCLGEGGRGYIHNASCFNTTTSADLITADGSKVIGSAQRHRGGAVLQHGAMVLDGDRHLFETVFGQLAPWQQGLNQGAQRHSLKKIIETLTWAASQCLNINFQPQPLSSGEYMALATHLLPLV